MEWVVVGIIAGLIVFDFFVHAAFSVLVLRIFEHKPPFDVQPADEILDAERISITTADGLTLRGNLRQHEHQSSQGLIIFCPELGGSHWSSGFYAEGLFDAGFDVLAFDFRNQGESDHMAGYDPLHWLTDYEVRDLTAAIEYARHRDDLKYQSLGLFGVSRGGSAALAVAARCNDIEFVACEGAFSTGSMLLYYAMRWGSLYLPEWLLKLTPTWHLKTTLFLSRSLSQFRRRCRYTNLERLLPRLSKKQVLMISGLRDTYVCPEIAEQMRQQIGDDCRPVWMVPKAKHNMARLVEGDTYDQVLVDFFAAMPPSKLSEPMIQS